MIQFSKLSQSLRNVYNRVDQRILRIFALGFVSGIPFLLTLSTLSYWLAEEGASKTAIGLFMIVSLPYSFKFIWAPLTDHVSIPYLTNRLGESSTLAFDFPDSADIQYLHHGVLPSWREFITPWVYRNLRFFFFFCNPRYRY